MRHKYSMMSFRQKIFSFKEKTLKKELIFFLNQFHLVPELRSPH